MTRRIFGLETEFGVMCAADGIQTLAPEEIARHLFRKVVAWGRSSNVFLRNGSRLYLDVGSHPEYATAECDSIAQLIAYDRGGERIMEDLVLDAQRQIEAAGIPGTIHMFKNNTDSAGNSYGCHENYLVRRQGDFNRLADILVPFLITRQILTGSGKILTGRTGTSYNFSQRADYMWEAVSSSTTRSRPIINTRDEPHADAQQFRRLHVIVGDSSMSEPTTLLKMGSTDLVLRMIEAGVPAADVSLENPMKAIRDISHDISGKALFTLKSGKKTTAIAVQRDYWERAVAFVAANGATGAHDEETLDLWDRGLTALETGDLSSIESELDWAIKLSLVRRYQDKLDVGLDDPRIARLDLAYHDISRTHGLYHRMVDKGLVKTVVAESAIEVSTSAPPQTTRAKLRGEFVSRAEALGRDFTVDWVHLKLNEHPQRTVACKDPFAVVDDRVTELMESMIG